VKTGEVKPKMGELEVNFRLEMLGFCWVVSGVGFVGLLRLEVQEFWSPNLEPDQSTILGFARVQYRPNKCRDRCEDGNDELPVDGFSI
jgi:hypothetical protein